MIYQNILEAIGHTPIVQLQRMVPEGAARVLVKYEGLNVGGSIKTRVAYNMIQDAIAKGIKAGDLVRNVCTICGGKGGGKPDSAMGGGSDLLKLDDALATVDDFVAAKI